MIEFENFIDQAYIERRIIIVRIVFRTPPPLALSNRSATKLGQFVKNVFSRFS